MEIIIVPNASQTAADQPANDRADAERALVLLDLTELGDSASAADVAALCDRAKGASPSVAAVCVWPRFVRQAVEALVGTGVRVATVVNFPTGDEPLGQVVHQTQVALADGADEIDLVLPYAALLAGSGDVGSAMVTAIRSEVPADATHRLKVILETGELRERAVIDRAARLAIRCGADFIKTSTGKTATSATPEATEVMLLAIRDLDPMVGLKPSGGIRTLDDARVYLHQADAIMGPAWASPLTFRFGASGLLTALTAVIDGADTPPDDEQADEQQAGY